MQKAVFRRCACIQLGFLLPAACCLLVAHFNFYAAENPRPPVKDSRVSSTVSCGNEISGKISDFLITRAVPRQDSATFSAK
jgi:hypothetical protein